MRIAMVGPFGFEPKKTMRARAFRLARELVARGHEVKLFMPPWHTPEQADRTWDEDGVQIRYIELGNPVQITRHLRKETAGFKPDIVHCFKPKAYSGLVAEWFWRTRSATVVMDSDDWEGWGGWNDLEDYGFLYKEIFARQERWGMRHAHLLTVASRALETLAWGNGVERDKVLYIPNGMGIACGSRDMMHHVPTATAGDVARGGDTASRVPTMLVYSRFFEFDVGRLTELIKLVREEIVDLRVLVVGASLMEGDGVLWREQMDRAGLMDCVEDAGWVEEDELPKLLVSADVGVYLMDDTLLNRTKCPVKLADMAGLGLPVVGEQVGQVSEYVRHGETGLLRENGDVHGLANDVIRLLRDDEMRQTFGFNAREHVMEAFSWVEMAKRLEAGYMQATSRLLAKSR